MRIEWLVAVDAGRVQKGIELLSNLDQVWAEAPVEGKHVPVSSIFPDRIVIENGTSRTPKKSPLLELISASSGPITRKQKGTPWKKIQRVP